MDNDRPDRPTSLFETLMRGALRSDLLHPTRVGDVIDFRHHTISRKPKLIVFNPEVVSTPTPKGWLYLIPRQS